MSRSDFPVFLCKVTFLIVVGVAVSSYASAGFAAGTEEQRAACTPDVFRLCSSEIPNVDNIIACMKAKQTSLSPPCRAALIPVGLRKAGAVDTISKSPR
jgi:hypothetical protein